MMKKWTTKAIAECAVLIASALVLSYFKIRTGPSGGSIDLVMLPLLLVAVRRGVPAGMIAGLLFGTLKFFIGGGTALNWQSMLLDYSLAYMMVGIGGVFCRKKWGLVPAALLGGFGRFVIHFISGVTIYAEYMPEDFLGLTMTSPAVYSALYNALYVLPSMIVAAAAGALLSRPLREYITGADMNS